MQKVIDFLRRNPIQFLATVGIDGKPKVRPFQMMYEEGGRLIFCTGAKKDVYAELLNPFVELCASEPDRWLRVRGRAEWLDDVRVKRRVIESSDLVKSIYKDAENPVLKAFYIAGAEAVISDFSGVSEVFRLC